MKKTDDIPAGWGTVPKRRETRRAGPKHLGAVTVAKIMAIGGFTGTTRGQLIIARFCAAVESGEVPDRETLEFIAQGLQPLLSSDGDMETKAKLSARKLGVRKKQGKRKNEGMGEIEPYVRSVLEFEDLAASLGNEVEARRLVAKREGIGDRAMRNRIRDYGDKVHALREFERAMSVLEAKSRE